MKPYDKKVINKKITQALIGVTAFGTILTMPISIGMQDNSLSIVKDNKAFAADNIKVGDTVEVNKLMVGDIFNISGIDWVVVAKNHEGYPDGSVTVMSKDILEKRPFDTKSLPSSHWGKSSLRAYLNGEFYNKLSEDLKTNILETHLINTNFNGKEDYYTDDKIFIPSLEEIGLKVCNSKPVGSSFNAFHDNASRIAKFGDKDYEWTYWTRVPTTLTLQALPAGTDFDVFYVYSNGTSNYRDINFNRIGDGVRPTLNLKSSTPVIYIDKHEHIKLDDKESPTIEVTGNTTSWTNKDVILNISAKDNNKVKSITLPDGKTVSSDKADYTVTKNGTYKFTAEDEAGNKTTKEILVDKIDKELPTLNLTTSATNFTNANVDINIDAKDTLSGIKDIKVNGTVIIGNKYTVSTNGTYTVEVTDNAGNKISKQITISNIDRELPNGTVTADKKSWTNGNVTLICTATDNIGVKSITLPDGKVIAGSKATLVADKNGKYNFIIEDISGNKRTVDYTVSNIDKELPTLNLLTSTTNSTNGSVDINIDAKDTLSGVKEIKVNDTVITGNKYTVSTNGTYTVEVIDNAGNKTSKQIDISNIDKELPTIAVSGNPTEWTNNNVVLNITAKDNIGVKSITMPNGKVVNSDKADFILNENGIYKFIVEDESGNKSTKEVVVNKIDKELPLMDVNVIGNKMTIAANDSLSGIKEVFYKIDDGEFIKYTGEVALSQGAHTIEAKAIDNAGNINKLKNKFNIEDGDVENADKEAPTLEITGNPVDWTNKDIILNVSAKDNKKVKSITLPDSKVVNGDKTTFTISKNGTYKFIVEDEAGNKTTKEVSINKIDKELPIANINVKDDKMTIAASDKLSGIKEIFYKIDNGEFVRYTGEVTLSPGVHKIKVKAIDNAGNMNDQNSTSSEVNVNVEDKSKKDLEDATKAVEKAETTKNEDDIDRAKEKVAKLPDGKDKDDLNNRLDDLEKQIKAEKDAYIKSYNAVKKAKTTLDKEDYEYAKKAVYDLNTTIYKNEKAQLQRVLDALKPYIDRKENQSKQEERNQIRNIESLIRKAIATKDPKTIEEAQAAIDKLESSDIKIELQKRLDTTNKVSQIDLAIQARDAVEKLDAYLNYSNIINNLNEFKDLYKEAEKSTNRLDNSSQYKSRMDKAKGYIEVMEALTKYKENAERNSILASEKEMTELISKANQLSFTTRNKQNIIKEILKFQEELKELREATTVPEA
ncbi:OmpL47-type beta-barrel domain-containing protein [Clostridium botulinum]|uniref:OmpL47-type beta-barrel domain-containing protein n=1 Tax=Clostridium botulinum TaxID=1491 RepID=UPI003DA5C917